MILRIIERERQWIRGARIENVVCIEQKNVKGNGQNGEKQRKNIGWLAGK